MYLEDLVFQLPQVDLKPMTRHYFCDGLYARELLIPKGTILTGSIHKKAHVNICSMGDITVTTDTGVTRVQAPFTCLSTPGTKRIGFAHEDTLWTTIVHTFETSLETIERDYFAKSFEDFDTFMLTGGSLCQVS